MGRLAIGFTAVSALTVLGRWVRQIYGHAPELDIVLSEMVSNAQIDAILANELDIGLMRGEPRSTMLDHTAVHAEPLVAAVPVEHPLAMLGRRPRLAELAEYNIITYAPDSSRYFHELVVSTFYNAGLAPNYAQYLTQVSSQLVLVEAGLGICLVPRSAVKLRPQHIDFVGIEDASEHVVELYACWRADHSNPAIPAALEALSSVAASNQPGDP